jgi:hypothetical protein
MSRVRVKNRGQLLFFIFTFPHFFYVLQGWSQQTFQKCWCLRAIISQNAAASKLTAIRTSNLKYIEMDNFIFNRK